MLRRGGKTDVPVVRQVVARHAGDQSAVAQVLLDEDLGSDIEAISQKLDLPDVQITFSVQNFGNDALAPYFRKVALLELVLIHQKAKRFGRRCLLGRRLHRLVFAH